MLFKSFISAFSMYSRIPMPQIEWKEENRRFSLCFFPLIGAVIGGLLILWKWVSDFLGVGDILFGAVCTVIPVLITGGIHLDGFCDVCDAKASCAPKEKALEIMNDSHIGAFAVISLAVYLISEAAFFSEARGIGAIPLTACIFVQSRALSGLGAVTLRCAKKDGALQSFSKPAHKTAAVIVLTAILFICLGVMVYLEPISGLAGFVGGALSFLYYKVFSYKRFGGITGDLAGYFLQICELFSLICIVITQKMISALL